MAAPHRILLTGASGSIGTSLALYLSRRGHSLILHSHTSPLNPLLASLSQPHASLPPHEIHQGDISSADFWAAFKRTPNAKSVTCLINNAGTSQLSPLALTSADKIASVLDTNLKGTILATKTLLPTLMKSRNGVIVNISSLLAVKGMQGSSIYAASKAGLLGLQRSLVCELKGKGVRVNTVLPGFVESGMTEGMGEEMRETMRAKVPLGRFAKGEEVAEVVGMCIENGYLNGAEIVVDGGLGCV
ncbi:NAD(P)-binding protein [Ascobolus immersus RN42]|uniref:NAD(P)-binding protein n=1 Tax=Ascobolus immersus RN42 TaxID=1160509 RepID=A0A3N4HDW2_ASCIM|nr:NAD(P)-binding protein [Ascobolus immersus RN42]